MNVQTNVVHTVELPILPYNVGSSSLESRDNKRNNHIEARGNIRWDRAPNIVGFFCGLYTFHHRLIQIPVHVVFSTKYLRYASRDRSF